MTRVLHLLGTAQPDSASVARIVATLATRLRGHPYELHACFMNEDGMLRSGLEKAGVPTLIFPWTDGLRSPVRAWQFARALRQGRFSILHQHTTGRAPRLMAHMAGIRTVLHLHWLVVERNFEMAKFETAHADRVIATSKAVAARADQTEVRVIYPGVEPHAKVASTGANALTIGFAGRLATVKGVQFLLESVAQLRNDFPSIRVELAGVGPECNRLHENAERMGISDQVAFLGWQDNLERVLERWDIFVLPSLQEGFGIAALEAMACGVPVVASAVGGLPELIEGGTTGILVAAGDSAALASAIRKLAIDSELRRRMGEASRQRAIERFSAARMAEDILGTYRSLDAAATARMI